MPAPAESNANPRRIWVHNLTELPLPKILPHPLEPHPESLTRVTEARPFSVLILSPAHLSDHGDYDILFQYVAVLFLADAAHPVAPAWCDFTLRPNPSELEVFLALEHSLRVLHLKEERLNLHNSAAVIEARNRQLNQIGIALMGEKNVDRLLQLILEKAMSLTGSDAGCLYLVENRPGALEGEGNDWSNRQIRFKLTRNCSVPAPFEEVTVPASKNSIVGYAMMEGRPLNIPDVYRIPETEAFRHNHGFDQSSGYFTRSMLTLPMKDKHGTVIGAIQLINKCRSRTQNITSQAAADSQVIAYRQEDLDISLSLASQAAIAIVNAQHEEEIKQLFEGFITASVVAIESRDPTTSGHSNRVGSYSIQLAQCVERGGRGRYRDVRFSSQDLRELRYAALLHDFGKIGVREHVLTKAKKLFPDELSRIDLRLDHVSTCMRWQCDRDKLRLLLDTKPEDPKPLFEELDRDLSLKLKDLEELKAFLKRVNEPMPLTASDLDRLKRLVQSPFRDPEGQARHLLLPDEMMRLSIPRGTLSPEERAEIESHVTHTYRFLSRIPWTRDLRRVPDIAHAHHEKLDGSGYPQHLAEGHIPVASKIMTVCDIYDALAAADRPYKKAMPPEKALGILQEEVKTGKLDQELVDIFIESQVYQLPMV
jgi:HD-GYP domain-containing protein (c-di-GMP phosphodiesterase class II)